MLTICPTPIGNLDDATPRQKRALAEADVIACEDTRRTGKLLEHLGIEREGGRPRLVSHHEHNEQEAVERLTPALKAGRSVVLVSDAGTPAISDPGYRLVRRAIEEEVPIESLPGPNAAVVALAASGLPTHAFQFRGFPPTTSEGRQSFLREVAVDGVTTTLYESPNRVLQLVRDVSEVLGEEREVCVARELTKRHEEYIRGRAAEVVEELAGRERVRGECVVVIAAGDGDDGPTDEEIDRKIEELLERGLSARTIKEVISELYEVSRSSLYERIEALKE